MAVTDKPVVRTEDERPFYRVEPVLQRPEACGCNNCLQWTVVYYDPEPTEIGTSWRGNDGKEVAQDTCDLMNMAYDRGRESK